MESVKPVELRWDQVSNPLQPHRKNPSTSEQAASVSKVSRSGPPVFGLFFPSWSIRFPWAAKTSCPASTMTTCEHCISTLSPLYSLSRAFGVDVCRIYLSFVSLGPCCLPLYDLPITLESRQCCHRKRQTSKL